MVCANLEIKHNRIHFNKSDEKPQKHDPTLATLKKIERAVAKITANKKYTNEKKLKLLSELKDECAEITTKYTNKANKKSKLTRTLFKINEKIKAVEAIRVRIEKKIAHAENRIAPGLFGLPSEMVIEIFRRMDFIDLFYLAQVSKKSNQYVIAQIMDEACKAGYSGQDLTEVDTYLHTLRDDLGQVLMKHPRYGFWRKDGTLDFYKTMQKLKFSRALVGTLSIDGLYSNEKLVSFFSKLVKNAEPEKLSKRLKVKGGRALFNAAQCGSQEIVRFLLRQGIDSNIVTEENRNALHFAAENNHTEVIEALLKHGCDIEQRDASGRTPLCLAVESLNFNAVRVLLRKGADIKYVTEHGKTLLMRTKNRKMVHLLLKKGASKIIDQVDDQGKTALHHAAKFMLKSAEEILEHGANINIKDNKGRTPLKFAEELVAKCRARQSPARWEQQYENTCTGKKYQSRMQYLISQGATT